MTGHYATTWRTTPARIAEEHRLHVAQIETSAYRELARQIAERRGLALRQPEPVTTP